MDWVLYDIGLRHERVKYRFIMYILSGLKRDQNHVH